MMFIWLPLLFLIPFAIYWMARSSADGGCCGVSHAADTRTPASDGEDPLDIASQRLARGEITVAEFDEIRRAIG